MKLSHFVRNFINFFNFKKTIKKIDFRIQRTYLHAKNPRNLKVAIDLGGGIGDFCFLQIWINEFYKSFSYNIDIDVYGNNNCELIFRNYPFIVYKKNKNYSKNFTYDLKIKLRHYPIVEYYNKRRIKKYFPRIISFIEDHSKIVSLYRHIFNHEPFFDGLWAELMMKYNFSRHSELYINNSIFTYKINNLCTFPILIDDFNILKKRNIDDVEYITIHNGANINNSGTGKRYMCNYPDEKLNEVCTTIKKLYPEYKIIQIGHPKSSRPIKGVDINLIGETSFLEALAILKKSTVHIDGDSGFVHANANMLGKSVVFYGPTPMDYLKYESNINICKNMCRPCMWDSPEWFYTCLAGFDKPICLDTIPVKDIVDAVCEVLKSPQKSIEACKSFNYDNIHIKNVAILNIEDLDFLSSFIECQVTLFKDIRGLQEDNLKTYCNCFINNNNINIQFITGDYLPGITNNFDIIFVKFDDIFNTKFMEKDMAKMVKKDGYIVYVDESIAFKKIYKIL